MRHLPKDGNLGHLRNYNKGISLSRRKYVCLAPQMTPCGDDICGLWRIRLASIKRRIGQSVSRFIISDETDNTQGVVQ